MEAFEVRHGAVRTQLNKGTLILSTVLFMFLLAVSSRALSYQRVFASTYSGDVVVVYVLISH